MNVNAVIPLIAAIIYTLLLAILIASRPWRRRHRIFAWFLIGALLWSVSNIFFRGDFLLDHKLTLAKITIWSFTFMLVPFCYFVSTFLNQPREKWLVLAYVPPVSTAILAALGYLPDSVESAPTFHPHYNMWLLGVFVVAPLVVLLARGLYLLMRDILLSENPILHNQLIYLTITIGILGVSVLSNLTVVGRQLPIAHVGNLAVAGLLAYATFRYQLLDIKVVVQGGVVYGGIVIITAASYFLLLFIFREWFGSRFDLPAILTALAMAGLIASLFYPLRQALQRGVDRLLFPGRYDYRRTLLAFARKAGSIIKIDELGRELTTLVFNAVGPKRVFLLLRDNPNEDLHTRFVVPDSAESDHSNFTIRHDSPILSWFKKDGSPLLRETMDIRPEFSSLWKEEKLSIAAAEIEVFAPLISHGNIVGVLALSKKSPPSPYDLSDVELIRLMANEIAIAIENAQLHARIETQAITDALTQLYNRRHFDERLREEISRESRYGGKFSLALMDLDRFKAYNDTYGHLAGDALLVQAGRCIRESVRVVDP
ncbi:MAG: diguanylate cyclase, partial [Dehalococcoidia bacterium]|nr:diguanylate cyclase [Dehalococcoidia bacterium]